MPIFLQLAIQGILAAAALLYYWRMAMQLPASEAPKIDIGRVDVAFASMLGLYIIAQTVESFGKQIQITPEAINLSILIYCCVVLMILGVLIGRDRNPLIIFGLRWPKWKSGILVSLASLLAVYPIIFLPVTILHLTGVETETQDVVQYLGTAKGLAERLPMILMAVAVAPIAEEFIFRGYLHGVLRKYSGRWISLLVTSLVFAAMHRHLPAMLPLSIFAVALTLVYEKTRSLWAPIIMHATFNSITVAAAFAWPDLMK